MARRVLVAAVAAALCLLGPQLASAANDPAAVHCTREQKAPPPPPGGAVFARPVQPGTNPNVVVIPADSSWTPSGSCAAAEQVMTHPGSIEVGRGGAVLLRGTYFAGGHPDLVYNMTSAWGAKDDNSNPDLIQSERDVWHKTTEARTVGPQYLLTQFDSCRYCDLEHVDFRLDSTYIKSAAFPRDLEGANLQGATLRGNLRFFNFSHADLSDANLSGANLEGTRFNRTRVDSADFDGTDLQLTQMTSLRFDRPPDFRNVVVGGSSGFCGSFKDTDLTGTGITIKKVDPGRDGQLDCTGYPFLPGSTAPLSVLAQTVEQGRKVRAKFNFDGATFVASSGDRADLAGGDLSGQQMKGVRFVGFPVDFVKTDFRKDQLQDAVFDGAETFRGQLRQREARRHLVSRRRPRRSG